MNEGDPGSNCFKGDNNLCETGILFDLTHSSSLNN